MLTKSSPSLHHRSQNLLLIFLSLFFLPLSTLLLTITYGLLILLPQYGGPSKRHVRRSPNFVPKKILVTGLGMAKGLRIARFFYEAGHDVIGADFEPDGIPVSGRFSRSVRRFYRLSKPNCEFGTARYIEDLINIVRNEDIDLWVSCSGVASALEDGQAKEVLEQKTLCKCIQFDVQTTKVLHEKNSFIRYVAEMGLPAPETHDITSREDVHKILQGAPPRKKYIMKNVGMYDAGRADMTLLPRRMMSETRQYVCDLDISKENPRILQQFVAGQEYCTHALIIRGKVKAFVACQSSDVLMHYRASLSSGLSDAMLQFTEKVAEKQGGKFNGHLSFDFMVEETATKMGVELKILPIECNPRAHTAVVLFEGRSQEMAEAYLEALGSDYAAPNGHDLTNCHIQSRIIGPTPSVSSYYWIGHDIVSLLLHPFIRLLRRRLTVSAFLTGYAAFFQHLIFWKEGTYELWDPLPWWWLYHVYWPGTFLVCLTKGRRWSRVNVSTGKVFEC